MTTEIEIRFSEHPGFFHWGTARFQEGFWPDHVDGRTADGRWVGAHFAGVKSNPEGYDAATVSRTLILRIPATVAQKAAFDLFLEAQVGKSYDFKSLIAFAFNRDWQEPDAWFCDELIAAALVAAGRFPKLDIPLNRLTLRDLYGIVSGILLEAG